MTSETKPNDRQRAYHHGDLRSALIASAEIELTHAGLDGFSLRACARRAGVSHTAPKHHFGSVDGLLTAVATSGFVRLTKVMERYEAEADTSKDRLVACGCGYVAFANDNPTLFKLMFSERTRKQVDRDLNAAQAAAFDVLRKVAADANPNSSTYSGMLDVVVAWALVHGLSHLLIEGARPLAALESDRSKEEVIADVLRKAGVTRPLD